MTRPLSLTDDECAEPGCEAALDTSVCSYCHEHGKVAFDNRDPETFGLIARKAACNDEDVGEGIGLFECETICTCCHPDATYRGGGPFGVSR